MCYDKFINFLKGGILALVLVVLYMYVHLVLQKNKNNNEFTIVWCSDLQFIE